MPSSTPRERHCNHSFPSIFDFTPLYPSVLKDLKRECAEVRISCKKIQKSLENLVSDKSNQVCKPNLIEKISKSKNWAMCCIKNGNCIRVCLIKSVQYNCMCKKRKKEGENSKLTNYLRLIIQNKIKI